LAAIDTHDRSRSWARWPVVEGWALRTAAAILRTRSGSSDRVDLGDLAAGDTEAHHRERL
jgi:hypothetical protein